MLAASGIMLTIGLGLGMVMQVLVITVQNAVDYRELGVATSGATLFRFIGGSVGTAVLGAIFAARLDDELLGRLPTGTAGVPAAGAAITMEMLAGMSAPVRDAYAHAFAASLSTVFLAASVVALIGFFFTVLLPEHPLRATIAAEAERTTRVGEAFAMPVQGDSLDELLRGLAAFANRDLQRQYLTGLADEAGVRLSPLATWLLIRLERDPGAEPSALARSHAIDTSRLEAALNDLLERELIAARDVGGDRDGERRFGVTPNGCAVLSKIIAVRRAHVTAAAAEWGGERARDDLALRRLARELIPEPHPSVDAPGTRGADDRESTDRQ
jgi:DNA-binding MarR family transcriptional regulator